MITIHPTAIVDPDARLGANVAIGPFSYIEKDVVIGDETSVGPHITILQHTTVGKKCRIHSGAVLGDVPQDLAFPNEESYLDIGSDCIIREGVTIHRGTKPQTTTIIGNGCYLMGFSHFAHNVKLGNGVIVANGTLCGGYVEIGERAFVSGNCGIHQFVRIGRLAMVGAVCMLSKDVPPFCTAAPAAFSRVAGVNVVGMRRAGMDSSDREDVKRAFAILYRSGLNVTQALEKIRASFDSGPALDICSFVETSKRGICAFVSAGDVHG